MITDAWVNHLNCLPALFVTAITTCMDGYQMIKIDLSLMGLWSSVVDGSEVSSELLSDNAAVLVGIDGCEPIVVSVAGEAKIGAGSEEGVVPGSELARGEETIVVRVVLFENGLDNSAVVSHLCDYVYVSFKL